MKSGFCTPGHPEDSHKRCPVERSNGEPCTCDCHLHDTITPTGWLVTQAEPDTTEWFAARRDGITGTDLPKILGLTKYGNALSVWLNKRDELEDEVGEAARWGNLLEGPVALEWAERNDAIVMPVGVIAHTTETWMRASLDRLVAVCPDGGDKPCGLEIKTRSAFKASDWRDGIPDDTLAQVAWGRLVTGLDHMHVAALIGGQRLTSFRYDRDEQLEDYLLTGARPVWEAVKAGTPPEVHPDAEGILLGLLDRMYAKRAGDREIDAAQAAEWLDQYAEGGDLERQGKALKTQAKTALVQLLDDGDTGLIDEVPRFTYQRPDPADALSAEMLRRLRVDQPDTYALLREEGYITTTTPGPRFNMKKAPVTTKETAA